MEQYEVTVEGMSCTGCEETVTNAVENIDGVYQVDANHTSGRVDITADEGMEDRVRQAIHDAGFEVPT
jgi:copper chaperone